MAGESAASSNSDPGASPPTAPDIGEDGGGPGGFLLYLRGSDISDIHAKGPWVELPEAFGQLGYRSVLVAGRVRLGRPLRAKVYETGVVGEGAGAAWSEFPTVVRVLRAEHPAIAVVYAAKSPVPLYVLASRLRAWLARDARRRRTVWINKLDWDVQRAPDEGRLTHRIRCVVIAMTSHVYDWTTVEGEEGLMRLANLPMVSRRKLRVFPLGYAQDVCRLTRYDDGPRERLVLSVARVARQKGLDHLLAAFATSHRAYPDWRLVLVGPVTEPGYFAELSAEVGRLGIGDVVRFAGRVSEDELSDLYRRASIFCLPSVYESGGNVRYEAMESGIPLLTTTAGPGRDLERMGARVVAVGDVPRLAHQLSELMADDGLRASVAARQQAGLRSYLEIVRELVAAVTPRGP